MASNPFLQDWLESHSLPIQQDIHAFLRRHPEDGEEFLQDLMAYTPQVKRGRINLLYECWLAVPCKLALEIAATSVPSRSALLSFIDLSANALLTSEDAEAFEECRLAEDPLEEHLCWLRERAYMQKLAAIEVSGRVF